jgi:hypothetical protein
MGVTIRHGLPLLTAAQAQKEVTHNEALQAIDRIVQLAVESRLASAPPAVLVPGTSHIVATGATGAWAGQAGRIASYDGFGWTFTQPVTGCIAWIVDEAVFTVFDGGWFDAGWPVAALVIAGRRVLGAAPVAIVAPAGGATIDAETRAAFGALTAALQSQGIIL